MLSYGVLQLNTEIDPQIGKLGGIILSLILLHVYEFALLGAAAALVHQFTQRSGRQLAGAPDPVENQRHRQHQQETPQHEQRRRHHGMRA